MDRIKIVDEYIYARLEEDLPTLARLLKEAAEHDKANPTVPPIKPLLINAAHRYPMIRN